jgi:hypothetical protein
LILLFLSAPLAQLLINRRIQLLKGEVVFNLIFEKPWFLVRHIHIQYVFCQIVRAKRELTSKIKTMKKLVIVILGIFLLVPAVSSGQNKAIGLRFGGGSSIGAEISYQTPFAGERLELDLGWGGNSNWNYWNLTGLYQWVMPIESGFYWYLGLGPSLGSWNWVGSDYHSRSGGMSLALALNAGVEYNFSEVPFQLSIDTRPELGIVNRYDDNWFGLALAARYRF